jgi:hypothetical protein
MKFESLAHDRSTSHSPNINWGSGRLLPYESCGAFVAKFCTLNGISPKELRGFLDELFDDNSGQIIGNISRTEISDIPWLRKRLALLLDENESVVAKLGADKMSLSGCYGTFSYSNYLDDSYDRVSYCPECARIGYHASFHEFAWLGKCPIHRNNLIVERVNYSCRGSKFDNYVKWIEHLLSNSGSEAWLSNTANIFVERKINEAKFRQFESWIRAVRRLSDFLGKSNLISLWGSDYSMNDLDVLLGRIGWSVSIPSCINDLFIVQAKCLEPMIIEYSLVTVNKLATVLSKVEYKKLAWFYKMTIALANDKPNYVELVMKAVENMKSEGDKTGYPFGLDLVWARENYNGWIRVCRSRKSYFTLKSPYQVAAIELQREWAFLSHDEGSYMDRNIAWREYNDCANIFYQHGFVSPMVREQIMSNGKIFGRSFLKPMVRFNFDADLKELLEDLLYEEAQAHIGEVRAWLKSVLRGAVPFSRRAMPSMGNLFIESGRAYLCTWPVGEQ